MRDLILAVDQGTQTVRGMIFDLHGQLVAKSQIHIQPYYSRQVQLAKETGLTREGLYKALSADGNPSLGLRKSPSGSRLLASGRYWVFGGILS